MNDCLFPEFRFVTLTEHVVDTDLIAFDPITASCMNTEALFLLDPFALPVLFQKSNSSVRSEPKAYPWLLDARQVHISVLFVVSVEDIANDVLEEFISADLGNGARSVQVGRCMLWLPPETATEGTVDIGLLTESMSIQSGLIVVSVESLSSLTLLRLTLNPRCIEVVVALI